MSNQRPLKHSEQSKTGYKEITSSQNIKIKNIGETSVSPKVKKEKKKNMHIEIPIAYMTLNQGQTGQENSKTFKQSKTTTVHHQFFNHASSCYTKTGSKNLENLSHLPHYQYMQNNNMNNFSLGPRQVGSLPSTPSNNMSCFKLYSQSSPQSPLIYTKPSIPRFLQNAMHHPLLIQSIMRENNIEYQSNSENVIKKESPKRRNKNRVELNNEDKKFEPYLTLEDVEEGLKTNVLVEGVLRIHPKQFQLSYVSSSDRSEQDILIDGIKNRNRALEGDFVVVQLLSNGDDSITDNKQKKGKVVYIKEKVHTRTCIGILKLMPDKNSQKALFVPRDQRIPRLNIPFICWPDNFYADAESYERTLFLAKIFDWFDTRFALGKLVCTIGQLGDLQTETKAILAQTDLDVTPFGPEIRDLYPRLDYVIPEEEMKLREDCRNLCIFSIDPPNCRDIDDAVSCQILDNGNYEIGVHISDVSHFLTEGTILDEKVADKATTIYLVEKAYHMLPEDLCMLCSLFPGVDKLAFSVFWEITEDAIVINNRFTKSVIHSCCKLAYDHAQTILEDREVGEINFPKIYNGFQYKDISNAIKILGKISSKFRKKRFESGALSIDQPKVSFHLNPSSGLPDNFWIYEQKESHQLIEEFMLLANMTVAKKIYEDFPRLAFLRCHPPPSGYMLQNLVKSLKPLGIDLDISSAGSLHKSLSVYVDPKHTDKGKAMVLNMLFAKPMTRAKYFCADSYNDDEFHHYALNVPLYTHFTSPIRRYADIMVHRLLSASLNYQEVPKWDIDKVRMIAAQCNKQKYNAKRAGELSTEFYMLKYIEMYSPFTTKAVVVEIREKYIDVIIIAMGLNRRIFFNNDFPGEYKCIKNEAGIKLAKMELTWKECEDLPCVQQTIEIFSILQVQMYTDEDMGKIETKLVRPR